MLTLHVGDQSVFYPNELKSSGLELIMHAEKAVSAENRQSSVCCWSLIFPVLPTVFSDTIEPQNTLKFLFSTA